MNQFFAVDGPTGVGKSTVMAYLKQHLPGRLPDHIAARIEFCKDSEGSPLSEQVRELARVGVRHKLACPKEQILLFWTSRLSTCRELARLIQNNRIPIVQRFGASTWAHQVYYHNRVGDLDKVHWDMVDLCVVREGLTPPHYLMLTAPPHMLEARVSSSAKGSPFPREVTLSERIAFFEKLQDGYREYIRHSTQNGTLVDASASIQETGETVIQAILDQFKLEGMLKTAA